MNKENWDLVEAAFTYFQEIVTLFFLCFAFVCAHILF